jgi:hypothetical protein
MATTPAGRAALRRIGPTPVHRARWLLKFSAEDVDSLSATAGHDLCQEVTAYIDVGLPRDRALTGVVDPAMVRRCQTWLRDGLHTLKRTNLWKFSLSLPSRCVLRLDERVFYIVSGISTGFYSFQQVFATISAPIFAERLCYCPRSECGRPAEQGTTLLHHSVRAAGTVQRFRRKHSDYRREQHVKSARAKTGGPRVMPVRRRTKRSGPQLDTNAQPE